jgi:hypothetical protein
MLNLDTNEFWTQALSALLAGVVLLFLQPQWLRRPKQPQASGRPEGGIQLNGRNQMVNTGQVHGDLHQEVVDRSQRTTVITNIHGAAPSGGGSPTSDTPWGLMLAAFIAAVTAAALFLTFQPLFLAVSVGAALGLLVLITVAAVRTHRLLAFWPRRAVLAILFSVLACVVTVASWVNVTTTVRGPLSLDQIRGRLASGTTASDGASPVDHIKGFFQITVPSLMDMGMSTVFFVLTLILGVLAAFALIVSAWFLALEWHAYLRFSHDSEAGELTTNRAKVFSEGKIVTNILASVLLASLAIALSNGTLHDLYSSWQGWAQTGATSSPTP